MAGLDATATQPGLEKRLEAHRRELTGYCYRMLGSIFEAEDAVQETMLRAWRGHDRFEGRAALKSWLYRIATNVCLDMIDSRRRRARPMDLSEVGSPEGPLPTLPQDTWIEPIPDGRALPDGGDPAELAVARETLRLAFVGALQHLPARQRAVLILREVLRWKASEVAELLETSVASVNSALQRARTALADSDLRASDPATAIDAEQARLVDRYVEAFESYDIQALVALLHEDATMSMPPYSLWLRGPLDVGRWMLGIGSGCRGSRLVAAGDANGSPAFGQYRVSPEGGHAPWGLIVLEISGGRISALNTFLDVDRLFPVFGLPDRLPAAV
ncbi:MAG: polymerase sigma-70 factor, subfamily [Solirubrobacteraceae bacterium]|jgi:RNA polymerase sigma-70 factor (ECF subfamily)|nr:polymerase sigma-70 factor, subfamily [Solirubrobacteraceae bacterium]